MTLSRNTPANAENWPAKRSYILGTAVPEFGQKSTQAQGVLGRIKESCSSYGELISNIGGYDEEERNCLHLGAGIAHACRHSRHGWPYDRGARHPTSGILDSSRGGAFNRNSTHSLRGQIALSGVGPRYSPGCIGIGHQDHLCICRSGYAGRPHMGYGAIQHDSKSPFEVRPEGPNARPRKGSGRGGLISTMKHFSFVARSFRRGRAFSSMRLFVKAKESLFVNILAVKSA